MPKFIVTFACALLLAAGVCVRQASAGEKSVSSQVPSGHREVVKEREAARSSSSRTDSDSDSDSHHSHGSRHHDDDDDDDDDDGASFAAELLGAIILAPFSGHGDHSSPRRSETSSGSTLFDDNAGKGPGWQGPGPVHPWLSHGQGVMARFDLGVARYDGRRLHEAASGEMTFHMRAVGTWGLGLTAGGAWNTTSGTGSVARGTVSTGVILASTNVDIPLGRGWAAPILSLGGGIGGLYFHPTPDHDLREDLSALDLRLEQDEHWYLDRRARADIFFPLDRTRNAFLGLGAARDWAGGAYTSRMVDRDTGETLSRDRDHINLNRTTYQLSLVVMF